MLKLSRSYRDVSRDVCLTRFGGLDMRRLILALLLVMVLASQGAAQYVTIPGGALLPDGSLDYTLPAGFPFTINPYSSPAYGYGFYSPYYTSPAYSLTFPYVPVPMESTTPPLGIPTRRLPALDKP